GRVTLRYFQTGTRVEAKRDLSPVTAADREAEALVRAAITERFPTDGLLGEELGELNPGARRRWIVDPIDGTRSFVHGVPLYGVMLALEADCAAVPGARPFPAPTAPVRAARREACW